MGVIRDRWRAYELQQLLAQAQEAGLGGGLTEIPATQATDDEVAAAVSAAIADKLTSAQIDALVDTKLAGLPTGGSGVLHSGAGAPAAGLGSTSDHYFDTATRTLYGPKASGEIVSDTFDGDGSLDPAWLTTGTWVRESGAARTTGTAEAYRVAMRKTTHAAYEVTVRQPAVANNTRAIIFRGSSPTSLWAWWPVWGEVKTTPGGTPGTTVHSGLTTNGSLAADQVFKVRVSSAGVAEFFVNGVSHGTWNMGVTVPADERAGGFINHEQYTPANRFDDFSIAPLNIWPTTALLATKAEVTAATKKRSWSFSQAGVLSVKIGTHRLYNDTGAPIVIGSMRATVGTPPAGAGAITVYPRLDGSTVFGFGAGIAEGQQTATDAPSDPITWANGSYWVIEVGQVGSTTPGSDLVVTLTEA